MHVLFCHIYPAKHKQLSKAIGMNDECSRGWHRSPPGSSQPGSIRVSVLIQAQILRSCHSSAMEEPTKLMHDSLQRQSMIEPRRPSSQLKPRNLAPKEVTKTILRVLWRSIGTGVYKGEGKDPKVATTQPTTWLCSAWACGKRRGPLTSGFGVPLAL